MPTRRAYRRIASAESRTASARMAVTVPAEIAVVERLARAAAERAGLPGTDRLSEDRGLDHAARVQADDCRAVPEGVLVVLVVAGTRGRFSVLRPDREPT